MRRLRIALFTCLAVVLLAACDGGWNQPLGGPDHASYNATENVLTLANVTTLQQAFHTSVFGTPVARFGVLVVASGSTVTALDGTTGAQKWQQTLPDQINGGPFIDGTTVRVSYGPAAPIAGPSTEQGLDLFSGAEGQPLATSGSMFALRGDNSVRLHEVYEGPALVPFVQISGKQLDGQLNFTNACCPTFGSKYLYVAGEVTSVSQGIWAFDPNQACAQTCTAVWFHDMGGYVETPAIGPDGTLYVGGCFCAGGAGLTALDGNNGSVKWSSGGGFVGTPAVANGVIYSSSEIASSGDIVLAAVSAADGHTLWTGNGAFTFANPTVAGGVVYGTNGSEVVAYNANGCGQATCAPIWTASLGTDTPSGGLAISGGMLYVGTNTGVTAFKPTS